jgi:dienelactone hydrolase
MKLGALGLAALCLLPISSAAGAQLARQEFHAIPSVSMTLAEFLNGKEGVAITIAGQLRLPKSGPEKQPAVVLLHGASGPGGTGGTYDDWTRVLNEAGFATFALDSFAGRGVINLPSDVSRVSPMVRIIDAYRALDILTKHPMIDASRIAVMGFSHGAPAALFSNMELFRKAYGRQDVQFAAHISVYGFCFTTYREDENVTKPALLLHGSADDWLPVAPCRRYAERLKSAGKEVRLIEYPDAHHAYDMTQFRQPLKLAAVTPRNCVLAESEGGALVNTTTAQQFTSKDPCLEKGVTVAYHDVAAKKSHADVIAFLQEALARK